MFSYKLCNNYTRGCAVGGRWRCWCLRYCIARGEWEVGRQRLSYRPTKNQRNAATLPLRSYSVGRRALAAARARRWQRRSGGASRAELAGGTEGSPGHYAAYYYYHYYHYYHYYYYDNNNNCYYYYYY